MKYLKKIFVFIALFTVNPYSKFSYAQKRTYIMLPAEDSLSTDYKFTKGKLHTKDLYKVDYDIEMFNFLFPADEYYDERLLLFSALPNLETGNNWKELKEKISEENLTTIEDLKTYLFAPDFGFNSVTESKYLDEYIVVKQIDGKLYVPPYCLLERFSIQSRSSVFPSVYGMLNTSEQKITIKEYITEFKNNLPNDPIPFDFDKKPAKPNYRLGSRLWKEYLSKKIEYNGETVYQFWTAASSNGADSYDASKGVNRFLYLPGTGIIAGSYDFHFMMRLGLAREIPGSAPANKLTIEEWNENILNEKMMVSDRYKDIRLE